MMWIKICGITRLQDAVAVQDAGADAIGFIFAHSPRRIDPRTAGTIARAVENMAIVGVFVNPAPSDLRQTRRRCRLDIIQLHGEETPSFCRSLDLPVIKALRIGSESDLRVLSVYTPAWKILLEPRISDCRGGTGRTIPESLLETMEDFSDVILAGGINPDNAGRIAARFSPFGMDINSGVESSPGIKDIVKINQVIGSIHRTTTS